VPDILVPGTAIGSGECTDVCTFSASALLGGGKYQQRHSSMLAGAPASSQTGNKTPSNGAVPPGIYSQGRFSLLSRWKRASKEAPSQWPTGSVFDNPARNDALEYIAGIVEQADQPIGQWELRRKPGTLYARIRLTLYWGKPPLSEAVVK